MGKTGANGKNKNEGDEVALSKFLAKILRHEPQLIGIDLDVNGWADVTDLIKKINQSDFQKQVTYADVRHVVDTDSKGRYEFSENGWSIRAVQGHSVEVELGLQPATPPDVLYHGTVAKNLQAIMSSGLQKMTRNHVHLSSDIPTATSVASRRGKPHILIIDTKKMIEDNVVFYKSKNNVWLTDLVLPKYISLLQKI